MQLFQSQFLWIRQAILFALGLMMVLSAQAAVAQSKGALETLQGVTDSLVKRLQSDLDRVRTDEVWRKQIVEEELVPHIDFKAITKLVMGKSFASASKEQRIRFLNTFKNSLIDTYSSGLASYDGQDIALSESPSSKPGRASVNMEIKTSSQKIQVTYTMYQDKQGQWRLLNLIVNGVNLGKTYRNQFAQLLDIHNGDIDLAISNWTLGSVES